jgi:hypothetical protein
MPWTHALETLIEMIDEAQHAINDPITSADHRRILTAKRDALTEARIRIRDGAKDPYWVFREWTPATRR